jgi:hypothetical protein
MKLVFIAVALACRPGFALVDWSARIPHGLMTVDVVVTLAPFYARVIIYPQQSPSDLQRCCGDKPTSVIRLPVGDGKFCVSQSQPAMKWKMRVFLKPDVAT